MWQNFHSLLLQLVVEREVMEKSFEQELKELLNNKDLENIKQEVKELTKKKQTVMEEGNKFAQKTLVFFVDLHNQIAADINEMEEIRDSAIERRLEAEIEKQKALKQKLEQISTADV